MAFGTLELTLRPLKLAFLVDPADTAALTEAIQINTFLWGGMFNPIIPVFRRLPAVWRERFHGNLTAQTLVTGYLDAYDPDFVVTVGKTTPPKAGVGFREIIAASEILAEVGKDGTPKYGVGLIEVLNHFAEQELKFVRQHPLSIRLPEWGSGQELFFAATFGALPVELAGWFRKQYASLPGIEWKPCSLDSFAEFLEPENLFLRRLGNLHIERHPPNSFPRRDCIFFLDASKAVDIIDYWNLRAAGWNVIPSPKQAVANEGLQHLVCEFIFEHCYPLRGNPSIINTPTLVKSRCTSEAEIKAFGDLLQERKTERPDRLNFTYRAWQLPIWDEWARELHNAQCAEFKSDQVSHDLHDPKNAQSFKTVSPCFASRFGGHRGPRFANKIVLRVYGSDEPFAEAIPEAVPELDRTFNSIGDREFRFSKRGPVHLAHYVDWSVRLAVPKAEDFFKAWLHTEGWNAELSDKGHIARQMLKQLGGIWGAQTLADEGVISLLDNLSREKPMSAEAFRAELNRISQKRPLGDATKLAKRLVDLKAVQLGLKLQCPHCRQYSWYSVTQADYALDCPKCLQQFILPSHTPKDIDWAYRSIGPFSLPQRGYGAYTVLLTLRFFSETLDGATTPLLSFTAKKGAVEIEADLALFYQESKYDVRKTDLIFAECKSFNDFTVADAKRMSVLAEQFPGAVLVFATLKNALSKKEKRVLRPVVNRGRRRWMRERPYNPVLILTGIELFAQGRPGQTWKDAGGKHAAFANFNSWPRGELLTLCDATQQLYLQLPSWDSQMNQRRRPKVAAVPQTTGRPPTAQSSPAADSEVVPT